MKIKWQELGKRDWGSFASFSKYLYILFFAFLYYYVTFFLGISVFICPPGLRTMCPFVILRICSAHLRAGPSCWGFLRNLPTKTKVILCGL